MPFILWIIAMTWGFTSKSKQIWALILSLSFWVNYNDLTATSLESWLVREIIPK